MLGLFVSAYLIYFVRIIFKILSFQSTSCFYTNCFLTYKAIKIKFLQLDLAINKSNYLKIEDS